MRINKQIESGIIKGLLRGDSYKKVSTQYSVSTSTVHRVVQDLRKKVADFDDLRHLVALLNRARLTVYDATRAAILIDRLNTLAISIEQIEDFHKLMLRISNERDSDTGDLVESALKLMHMEQQTEKTCTKIVEEFQQASEKTHELEEEEKNLKIKLENSKAELEAVQAKKAETTAELHLLVNTNKRVRNVGLTKISRLAKFVADLERVGFNVREITKVLKWRRKLEKTGIDPEKLEEYLKVKGPLEKQITSLREKRTKLENVILHHERRKQLLLAKNTSLDYCNEILEKKVFAEICKNCSGQIKLPATQDVYRKLIEQNQNLMIGCTRCGFWSNFNPKEIVFTIGWHILPPNGNK
ncbi:MAG: hypothetical protein PVH12_08785 [Candidatus Bathyarchaeota archaeon]|jgi:chromosome segregation ATPase